MIVTDVGEKWVSPRFFAFLGGMDGGVWTTAQIRKPGEHRYGAPPNDFYLISTVNPPARPLLTKVSASASG